MTWTVLERLIMNCCMLLNCARTLSGISEMTKQILRKIVALLASFSVSSLSKVNSKQGSVCVGAGA